MHRRAFYLFLVFIMLLLGALGWWITSLREEDKEAWSSLKSLGSAPSQKAAETRQNKRQVRREIWTPSDTGRLETRLQSETSQFRVLHEAGKNEPVEEMQSAVAYMQEALEKGFQFVRVILANTATFYFKEDRFVAEQVKLYRFKLPGSSLPDEFPETSPVIEGEAKWMECYFKKERLDLNASQIVLRSLETKGALSAQSLLFDGRLARLNGQVVIDHSLGRAEADEGEVVLEKGSDAAPVSFVNLKGHVVLTRPTGAKLLSDKAKVDLKNKRARFTPVLYEEKGLRLKSEEAIALLEQERDKWRVKEIELLGHVLVTDPGKGTLATDNVVRVNMGEKGIEKIVAKGPSVLSRRDEIKDKSHTISIPGEAVIDPATQTTRLFRSEEKQIHVEDTLGEIYADEVVLFYEKDKGGPKLKKIHFEGKVFLAQRLPSEVERSYAYADRAEYDPETFEVVLEGEKPEDRVLIFDKINQLEVSAPKIRIKRNEATRKETIKGEGDVRFSLNEKEFQTLKSRFKLENDTKK